MPDLTPQQLYAQLYDLRVEDWTGELDFYREFLSTHSESQKGVLEIACGTGRVTIPLAKAGFQMTGFDLSPELLNVAQTKTIGLPIPVWVQADMRTFELNRKFGVILSPGHSFQFMNTPDEQAQCLELVRRHLVPGGWLILHLDHQDVCWLASLLNNKGSGYARGELLEHPITNKKYRYCFTWFYEAVSQTATVKSQWEEIDQTGMVNNIYKMDSMRLHCAFRSEIEHLLKRCGFTTEALYGDFNRHPLEDKSENMIWVAKLPA